MKTTTICGQVIDGSFLEQHFKDWIKSTIPHEHISAVETGIRNYLTSHPIVLERGDSWPQIRSLAERNGFIKL